MVMAADHLSESSTNTPAQQRQQTIDKDAFLLKALEAFLGKSESQIQDTILQTLEGHLRAILGMHEFHPTPNPDIISRHTLC